MLSMVDGSFTAESVAMKDQTVHRDWHVLFAGEDVGVVPSLISRLSKDLPYDEPVTVEQMTVALGRAFQDERRERATELYLSPYGVDLQTFMSNHETLFGETGAAVIRERIEKHELKVQMLAVGHQGRFTDDGGTFLRTGHLLSVEDPGVVKNHSVAGFWAIGTGWYLALTSLATRQQSIRQSLRSMLYQVCEAKFTAERALGVGSDTYVLVRRPDRSWACLDGKDLQAIRKEWERVGRPRPPKKALDFLSNWLKRTEWEQGQKVDRSFQPSSPAISSTDQT
jgi:hypothetical protein